MNERPSIPLSDRITGAIIDSVGVGADGLVTLSFRHRGTDDDSGYVIVVTDQITFNDEALDA